VFIRLGPNEATAIAAVLADAIDIAIGIGNGLPADATADREAATAFAQYLEAIHAMFAARTAEAVRLMSKTVTDLDGYPATACGDCGLLITYTGAGWRHAHEENVDHMPDPGDVGDAVADIWHATHPDPEDDGAPDGEDLDHDPDGNGGVLVDAGAGPVHRR
jgi:hypothetical protein